MAEARPYKEYEPKWQETWEKDGVYQADETKEPTFYGLIEFPFPSGEGLHVGHPRSYTAINVVTRKKRMEGYNVLYPIGFDAFGLPTENFAIRHKVKPQDATKKNIASFTRQLKSMGFGFDWSREINTTDPAYYKWTQWMFLQLLKHDLAYKATTTINWCPSCKIGLANEEAVGGVCERCGSVVEKREKAQWMIRITKYAERLIADLDTVDYLDRIKAQQINWIGKSVGAHIDFSLSTGEKIRVFTTRPDTIAGATYLVCAPEHEMVTAWLARNAITNAKDVASYRDATAKQTDIERGADKKEKTGVQLQGITATNPATGEEIPVWIADYVLAGYGTGAIMAVPAHDERDHAFAETFHLPVKHVVDTESETVKAEMIAWLEEKGIGERAVTYKLRDWVFSRQRYWGEPIPVIICKKCGFVPVPEEQLPVLLPDVESYEPTDTGESPLATIRDWVEVACPSCGSPAERETDTMPNWAGSSWYFLRYCDPHNDATFASPEALKRWMPVDLYNGGMEHTTLHLLYSRFWHKFLWDIGALPKEVGPEPYSVRRSHGMILAEGGEKMSKSKGNVINPDDVVNQYGADVLRVYELFIGPFDQTAPWDTNGIEGVKRFLDKVWRAMITESRKTASEEQETLYHQTIKKVTDDIEALAFNTAVSQLMILTNGYAEGVPASHREGYLKILAPFAPHLAEELWSQQGQTQTIHRSAWPSYDPAKTITATFELVIQVNGKVRDKIVVPTEITEEDAKVRALASKKVQKYLEGKDPTVRYVKGRLISITV